MTRRKFTSVTRRVLGITTRFAVIGNCQTPSMGRCLQAIFPRYEVHAFPVWEFRYPDRLREILLRLRSADLIFAQSINDEYLPQVNEIIENERNKVHLWPSIVFTGFHPDIIYVSAAGELVQTPMGEYNSQIVLGAFLAGLSVDDSSRLFNRFIYSQLGYFQQYELAKEHLLAAASTTGIDLNPSFKRWEKFGCFLYSINHPKIHVIADIAKLVAARTRLPFDSDLPIADLVEDELAASCIWPVYPEIGERLNIPGNLVFTPARNVGKVFTLPEFISGSFAIYRSLPQYQLKETSGIARVLQAIHG